MYFQARGEYNTWFKPDSQQCLDEWKQALEVFFGTFWVHWFQSRLELVDVMNDIIPQSIFPMKFKVSS